MRPLLLLFALLLARCQPEPPREVTRETPPLADVTRVAGRTPAEVAAVLGPPLHDPGEFRDAVSYPRGISVRYRQGRADRIQAAVLGQYRAGPEVLLLFGIDAPPPTHRDPGRLRWEGGVTPPFAVITLHTHPRLRGGTDYVDFFVSGETGDSATAPVPR